MFSRMPGYQVGDFSPGGLTPPPLQLLHFNGANGSTSVPDATPHHNNMTVTGGAALSTAQAKFGPSCCSFDGSSGYLSNGNVAFNVFTPGDGTIDCWIRPNSTANSPHVWQIYGSDINHRLALFLSGGTPLVYGSDGGGSGRALLVGTSTIPTGTWTHVAVCRRGSDMLLFVGGALQATTTDMTGTAANYGLVVGVQNISPAAGDWFNGYVDEFRVLSGVAAYKNASFTPRTIAYLP